MLLHWNIYITICKIDSQWEFDGWCREPNAGALWQPGGIGWGGCGWGAQDGGDTCVPMADSCWCVADAITIL